MEQLKNDGFPQPNIIKKFIIPVGNMSREEAEKQIRELMTQYHEDIQWDENLGEVKINGEHNLEIYDLEC
jgi:hypothetical protein